MANKSANLFIIYTIWFVKYIGGSYKITERIFEFEFKFLLDLPSSPIESWTTLYLIVPKE